MVTVTRLAQPSGGRVHQLWLMETGNKIRSVGLLEPDDPLVASGLGPGSERSAVTEEPAGGSPRPTSALPVRLTLASAGFEKWVVNTLAG